MSGARIAPSLPPPLPPDAELTANRTAELRGLRVGAAVLDLRLELEPDGIQVDLDHVSGEACRLRGEPGQR